MSSLKNLKQGAPKIRVVPRAKGDNDADLAAFLSTSYSLKPDNWQLLVLQDFLARRANGSWAASQCGLSVPRQNGKNAILEMIELYKLVGLGRAILHSAHEVKTARKAFLRLASFFDESSGSPEMAALVKSIRRTNGQEAILLHNGGSIEFIARTKNSGRGYTVDDLVLDEAQELQEDAYAALLPTISSSPSGNPQQILTGTPPSPKDNGEVFTRVRKSALSGKSRTLAWLEWGLDESLPVDDPVNWKIANPALGTRLKQRIVEDEFRAMSEDVFRRERGGLWTDIEKETVIPPKVWEECMDVDSIAPRELSFGIDINPARTMAAVAVAGFREDGKIHVELVKLFPSVRGLVDELAGMIARNGAQAVVIDSRSAATTIVDELRVKRIRPFLSGMSDMAMACGQFYDALMAREIVHIGQSQMTTALFGAGQRPIGEAWGWSRKEAQVDITPLVASTLAVYGLKSSKAKPVNTRRRRITVL